MDKLERLYTQKWYLIPQAEYFLVDYQNNYKELLIARHVGTIKKWEIIPAKKINKKYGTNLEERNYLVFNTSGLDLVRLDKVKNQLNDMYWNEFIDNLEVKKDDQDSSNKI